MALTLVDVVGDVQPKAWLQLSAMTEAESEKGIKGFIVM